MSVCCCTTQHRPNLVRLTLMFRAAGYMFTSLSVTLLAGAIGGSSAYYVLWAYCSICTAVFLVRTMKRIIFHEVRQYGVDRTMHNYLLLAVAVAQFPVGLWMGHV
mmetsp:Transcript_21071/g.54030  ORF Transcript_21071/g.54030 Transcript_21071/m.54030 type:complete len:105 (-) Transcript_21071:193-507(-)